mgnify:CR=1 FL=1
METTGKTTISKTIDRGHVALVIRNALAKDGVEVTTNIYDRQVIVNAIERANGLPLTYIVQRDGVIGPDPSKHSGFIGKLDALVQNVVEELHARGLDYNKDKGKYEGEFSRF